MGKRNPTRTVRLLEARKAELPLTARLRTEVSDEKLASLVHHMVEEIKSEVKLEKTHIAQLAFYVVVSVKLHGGAIPHLVTVVDAAVAVVELVMVETVKVEVVEIPVGKLLEIASVEIVLRRHEQFLGCATVVVHRLALGVYHPAILVLVVIYPHAYLIVDVTEDLEIRRVFARIRYAFAFELMHHSGIFENRLLRIYLHFFR